MWARRSPGQPSDATCYHATIVRACPRRQSATSGPCVCVDTLDGVTREPLAFGDNVIMKEGQSTAIKVSTLLQWGRPVWPIDMTPIPEADVNRLMPSLVGQVFFEDPLDVHTYYDTGAEMELLTEAGYGPDNDDPPTNVIEDLQAMFPNVITPQSLCRHASLLRAFFAKHNACQIMFTPAAALRPVNDPRVGIYGQYAECSFVLSGNRGETFSFTPPDHINVYVFGPSAWHELDRDTVLQSTIVNDTPEQEAMTEWSALDCRATKASILANPKAIRAYFGRWPHVAVSLCALNGQDPIELTGPVSGQCRVLTNAVNTPFALIAFDDQPE